MPGTRAERDPSRCAPFAGGLAEIPLSKRLRDARQTFSLYQAFKKLGDRLPEALESLAGSARTNPDRRFNRTS